MDYVIERNGVTTEPSYQEVAMIEAADLLWQGADDLPGSTQFALLDFGGVTFTIYRTGVEAGV